MLKPSYDALRQFQSTFSQAQNFQDFNKALKDNNLKAIITFRDLTLKLPSMEMDGLDSEKLEVSIETNLQELISIDLMPLPGSFPLKQWESMLLESLRAGIEEKL